MNQEQHPEPSTPNPEPRQRFLIIRLGSLGDLVHAVPAVAALRDAHPDAQIDWLVERAHAALLAQVPAVSRVIVLSRRSLGGWLSTRAELRAQRYDVAIDLQGLIKSAALARLSGAKRVLGFDTRALRESPARWFYTEQVEVGEGRHVIEKNRALVNRVIDDWRSGDLPITRSPDRPIAQLFELSPSPALASVRAAGIHDFVVLNPGAAWPNKRWPPESFAAVARWIHQTYGWTPVVVWGPGEEALADAIVAGAPGVAVRAPKTTFNDLLGLARASRVFVSGDTGPLHLACAMGAPVVALFGPTTEHRNGPWDDRDVSISRYDQCECHYQRVCRLRSRLRSGEAPAGFAAEWCLGTITVDEVTKAIAARVSAS
jgi:lipopolysaccharide heptosyltransferase I